MGDELGDFFARKDKKDKKGKKGKKAKFTTANEILQNAETKVHLQTEREKAVNGPAPLRPAHRTKEDEEWKDFNDEHVPDLTGLKLQSLTKHRQQQAEQAATGTGEQAAAAEDGDSDNEDAVKPEGAPAQPGCPTASGGKVWATAEDDDDSDGGGDAQAVASPSTVTAAASTAAEPAPVAAAASAGGKYVPPSQRGGMGGHEMDTSTVSGPSSASAGGRYIPPSQRRAMESGSSMPGLQPMQMGGGRGRSRNAAPDVNSDEAFPSLQAASGGAPVQRAPGFQDVHRGAAAASHGQQRSSGVVVENRYSNLR